MSFSLHDDSSYSSFRRYRAFNSRRAARRSRERLPFEYRRSSQLLVNLEEQDSSKWIPYSNLPPEPRHYIMEADGRPRILTTRFRNPVFHSYDQASHPNVVLPNAYTDDRPFHRRSFDANSFGQLYNRFINKANDESSENCETVHFRDGKRKIDYVLTYECTDLRFEDVKKRSRREVFEKNLVTEGLELELEDKKESQDGKTFFLKLHAPWEVLARYAEMMNMKMPLKDSSRPDVADREVEDAEEEDTKHAATPETGWCSPSPFDYDKQRIPDEVPHYTCVFNRERTKQFIIKNKDTFFSDAQRSRIVWEILLHASYDDQYKHKIGIIQLLGNGTYKAAFPLHAGKYDQVPKDSTEQLNTRTLLYLEWARPGCWYKRQPLHLIRSYFGDKIGIYFAWLGFYTSLLIPAAIVGLICFLYGVVTLDSSVPSKEICDENIAGNLTICPLCDKLCPFQKLIDSCDFSRITYLFDNPATVFFSIFMSFWATLFLEFWKRYQAQIAWEWDLANLEDEEDREQMKADERIQEGEPARPEFSNSVRTYRINPVTQRKEPYLPVWKRYLRIAAAGSCVLFMLAVVLAAVFGVIVYRIAVVTALYGSSDEFLRENAKIATSVTAAMMNLLIILIMDRIYQRIAVFLTNMERPRTQTEYDTSFTFKMFLFQCINFYSSLIYIAFFKGSLIIGNPSKKRAIRGEKCDPSGCLFELCVQLAIIMVGKQMLNNLTEIMLPKLMNWIRTRKSQAVQSEAYTRWERDYDLEALDHMTLFNEYLEMVIQFGFVTIFVAAFPLAPFFALLNNIVEIRLDAYKFVTQVRRPLAARANNIGAWLQILQVLSWVAVIVNSFVISYTSEFIPRMVYIYQYSHTGDLEGFVKNSLSMFNTSDYIPGETGPRKEDIDKVQICWYRDYRNPPNSTDRYERSLQYWHVFAARLAFVVVFEHLVFFLTGLVAYNIPDIPTDVRVKMRREKLLAKEALYAAELQKAQRERELSTLNLNQADEQQLGGYDSDIEQRQTESDIQHILDTKSEEIRRSSSLPASPARERSYTGF